MSGMDLGGVQGFGRMPVRPRLLGEGAATAPEQGQQPPVTGIGNLFENALGQVSALQKDVQTKSAGMITGEKVELHDIMSSMGKSEVAFNLMLEVRNKLVDAWEKISRAVV